MSGNQRALAIIGGGAAGLAAGLFAARNRCDAVLFERGSIGGQLAVVDRVENFIGFPEPTSGYELGPKLFDHAVSAGLETDMREVISVSRRGPDWLVKLSDRDPAGNDEVVASALILASGSALRHLEVPGERELHGSGVSYCATCDGELFHGREVAVVGGGDSAVDEATYLAGVARKVIVVTRNPKLHAATTTVERLLALANVEVRTDCEVAEIQGEQVVNGIKLKGKLGGMTEIVPVAGVFIYVGLAPNASLVADLVPLDPAGHIPVDSVMATGATGLYAAGDVRQHSARMFATAAGDGVTAAISAMRYLGERIPAAPGARR